MFPLSSNTSENEANEKILGKNLARIKKCNDFLNNHSLCSKGQSSLEEMQIASKKHIWQEKTINLV